MKALNPRELGYRMPAEWEPHAGTWISWPKDPDTFPSGYLEKVEKSYAAIVAALSADEKVNILVNDGGWEERAKTVLAENGTGTENVVFHRIKSVDVWTRDYAPAFIKNREGMVAAVKWTFNAWGDKYEELKEDDRTGEEIAWFISPPQDIKTRIFWPDMVLEGGSIDVNGQGTMLTTEQCLLNKNRNPSLGRSGIEQRLKDYLGIGKVIWLKNGVEGDDTDGHVDDIARFVNENTVVCAFEENEKDENYPQLSENFDILRKTGLNVIRLPMPGKIVADGRRLPASYANFYIGNGAVLVPAFGHPNDKKAQEIIGKFFPGRRVIGINCREFVYGFGAVHCATMQQPK